MNYSDRYLRQIASYSTVDVMLADVAVRIQLNPTDYQLAVDHYHAINEWLDREDSPLAGAVRDFYPQGGFAIGATVARHSSDDEFDIDVMADITYRIDVDPEDALATLHAAIRGERGSRYYLKTDRKTRCSTVNYDGMHLDVTPTVRLNGTVEKTGLIFRPVPLQSALGRKLTWYDLIFAAMRLQSLAATNQARLLLGPPAVRRIDPPTIPKPIMLDDFRRSR